MEERERERERELACVSAVTTAIKSIVGHHRNGPMPSLDPLSESWEKDSRSSPNRIFFQLFSKLEKAPSTKDSEDSEDSEDRKDKGGVSLRRWT